MTDQTPAAADISPWREAYEAELATLRARVEELEAEVQHFSTDAVTQIPGRGVLDRALVAVHARQARHKTTPGVMILDIDQFKRVNDEHGHAIGDEVLRAVAKVVSSLVRATDTVARYGGEEFVVLVEDATEATLTLHAQRIREAIEDFDLLKHCPRVTASIGIAVVGEGRGRGEDVHAALKRADRALYVAKEAGRNRVRVAE